MNHLPYALQQELLERIYQLHGEWTGNMKLACGKGCASCCTQSVTITGMEGRQIGDYLRDHNRLPELAGMLDNRKPAGRLSITTNAFAGYCLRGLEPEEPVHQEWDFTPCPFLQENCCTIYPVRPFGCRAFVSTVNCAETGSAEIAPLVLTVNTVYTQLIEHLAQGQFWGKMLDILACYQPGRVEENHEAAEASLRRAMAIPGLIVCEEEEKPVHAILDRFMAGSVSGRPIRLLLGLEATLSP